LAEVGELDIAFALDEEKRGNFEEGLFLFPDKEIERDYNYNWLPCVVVVECNHFDISLQAIVYKTVYSWHINRI